MNLNRSLCRPSITMCHITSVNNEKTVNAFKKITNMHQTHTCCNHSRNQQKKRALHEELARLSATTPIIGKNLFLSQICVIFNIDEIISVLQSHKNLYFSILAFWCYFLANMPRCWLLTLTFRVVRT